MKFFKKSNKNKSQLVLTFETCVIGHKTGIDNVQGKPKK